MKKTVLFTTLTLAVLLIGILLYNQPTEKPPKKENASTNSPTKLIATADENEAKSANEEKKTAEKEFGEYQHHRYYNSDVHVYISGVGETLAVTTGEPELETLKELTLPNEVAKINLGMFDSWFQHGGMYMVDGKYIQAPMARYINLHVYKDGRMDIKKYEGKLSEEQIETLRKETNFVVGTTYSLVQDGRKNLENADLFSHANSRNPRTLFGQRADGRYVLVAVDGRKFRSKGVTAEQSAEIMLALGCVEAVNMDGGGSTSLRVNGELKSNPSEGQERSIGSALFVIHE